MSASGQLALFKTKRVPTDYLDMKHAAKVLARDHEERLSGPPARPCRCPRPWPMDGECVKCGRRVE